LITFTCDRIVYEIDERAIFYIETKRNGTILHTLRSAYPTRRALVEWETILNRREFYKCHEGYLVNLGAVKGFERQGVTLTDGTVLEVSRRRRSAFYRAVFDYRELAPGHPLKA